MSPPPLRSRRCGDRACIDNLAGPTCVIDKHVTPEQSKSLAGTRVSPANHSRFRRVQHPAERRARATNAPLPPMARGKYAMGQAAATALQGAGSGSELDTTTCGSNPQAGVRLSRHHIGVVADVEATPGQDPAGQTVQ